MNEMQSIHQQKAPRRDFALEIISVIIANKTNNISQTAKKDMLQKASEFDFNIQAFSQTRSCLGICEKYACMMYKKYQFKQEERMLSASASFIRL